MSEALQSRQKNVNLLFSHEMAFQKDWWLYSFFCRTFYHALVFSITDIDDHAVHWQVQQRELLRSFLPLLPQGKPLSLSMATRPPEGPKGKSGGDCGKSCGGLGNNIWCGMIFEIFGWYFGMILGVMMGYGDYGGIPNSWMVEKMFIDVILHNVSRIDDLGMV